MSQEPTPANEGPYTDNGLKPSVFEYEVLGPGVKDEMFHLQMASTKPTKLPVFLLNFGFAQGVASVQGEMKEAKETIDRLEEEKAYDKQIMKEMTADNQVQFDELKRKLEKVEWHAEQDARQIKDLQELYQLAGDNEYKSQAKLKIAIEALRRILEGQESLEEKVFHTRRTFTEMVAKEALEALKKSVGE